MHKHVTSSAWTALAMAGLLTAVAGPVSHAQAQDAGNTTAAPRADAIHEHLDEADDAVDSLLDWRHVLTTGTREPGETKPPTMPASTLISVPRADVERLVGLLDAIVVMVPAPAQSAAMPRGDLRAHAVKAHEIARELMPGTAAQPVGTSGRDVTAETRGATSEMILVDRAALERLEIEIDAMESVAPRRLSTN